MSNTVEINFDINTEQILKNLEKLTEIFRQLNIVLPDLTRETVNLNAQLDNTTETSNRQSSVLMGNFSNISNAINNTIEIAQKMYQAFLGAFSATVGESVKFEKELAKINTLLDGDSSPIIKQFSQDILELQRNFGSDRATIAEAYYQALSSGIVDATNATDFMIIAQKLAVGGVTDINTAVLGLTSSYAVYKNDVKDMKTYSDIFFVTAAKGNVEVKDLANTMGEVSPVAKSFNVSIEELYASIGGMSTIMKDAPKLVTGLKAAMTSMSSPTDTMKTAMKMLGMETLSSEVKMYGLNNTIKKLVETTDGSKEQIQAMFGGSEAETAVTLLMQTIDTTKNIMVDMSNAAKNTGQETEEAFVKLQSTTSGKLDTLIGNIKATATEISNSFLPIVNDILDIINNFGTVVDNNKGLFLAFGVVIAGVTAQIVVQNAAMIAGAIATNGLALATKLLNIVLKANPIGLLLTALVAFSVYIADAIDKTIGFQSLLELMKSGILKVASVIVEFGGTIINWFLAPVVKMLELSADLASIIDKELGEKLLNASKSVGSFGKASDDLAKSLAKDSEEAYINAQQLALKNDEEKELVNNSEQVIQAEQAKLEALLESTKVIDESKKSTIQYNNSLAAFAEQEQKKAEKAKQLAEQEKKNAEQRKKNAEQRKKASEERKKSLEEEAKNIETLNNKIKELDLTLKNEAFKLIDGNKDIQTIKEIAGEAQAFDLAIKVSQLSRLGKVLEAEYEIKKAVYDANMEREKGLIKARDEDKKRVADLKKSIDTFNTAEIKLSFAEINKNPILKAIKELAGEETALNKAINASKMDDIEKSYYLQNELNKLQSEEAKKEIQKKRDEIEKEIQKKRDEIEKEKKQQIDAEKIVYEFVLQNLEKIGKSSLQIATTSVNSISKLISMDFAGAVSDGFSVGFEAIKVLGSTVLIGIANILPTNLTASLILLSKGITTLTEDQIDYISKHIPKSIQKTISNVLTYASPVFDGLVTIFKTSISAIPDIITTTFQTSFDILSGAFVTSLLTYSTSFAKSIKNTLSSLQTIFDEFKTTVFGDDKATEIANETKTLEKDIATIKQTSEAELSKIQKTTAEEKVAIEAAMLKSQIDTEKEISKTKKKLAEDISAINNNDDLSKEQKAIKVIDLEIKASEKINELTTANNKEKETSLTKIAELDKTSATEIATIEMKSTQDISKIKEENAKKITSIQSSAVDSLTVSSTKLSDLLVTSGKFFGDKASVFATKISDSFATITTGLVAAIPDFIKGIVDSLPILITTIIKNLPLILEAFIKELPTLIESLIKELPKLFDMLITELPKLLTALFDGIFKLLPTLIPKLLDLVVVIINKFIEYIPELITAFLQFVTELIKRIPQIVKAIVAVIPDIIKAIIEAIPDIINAIILAIPQIIMAIIAAIPQIIKALIDVLSDPDFIKTFVSSIISAFKDVIKEFPQMVKDVFVGVWDAVKSAFKAIDITAWFGDLASIGKKIWDGIISGFKSIDILSWFSGLADLGGKVWKSIKDSFSISGIWGKGSVEKWLDFDIPFMKFSEGGYVKGQNKVAGNSERNDTVPALLSPGEFVLDRKTIASGDNQIWETLAKNGLVQKYAWGGSVWKGIKQAGTWVANTAKSAVNTTVDVAKQAVSIGGKAVTGLVNVAVDTTKGAYNITKGIVVGTGKAIVSGDMSALVDVAKNGLIQTGDLFYDTAKGTTRVIGDIVQGTGTLVYDTAGKIVQQAIPNPFAEYLESLNSQFGSSMAWDNFNIKSFVKDPLNFVKEFLANSAKKNMINPLFYRFEKPKFFADGGFVGGEYRKGTDTVPSMLTPGELIIPKNSTNSIQDVVNFASQFFRTPNAPAQNKNNDRLSIDFSELISYLESSDRNISFNVDGINIAKAVRNQVKRGFAL